MTTNQKIYIWVILQLFIRNSRVNHDYKIPQNKKIFIISYIHSWVDLYHVIKMKVEKQEKNNRIVIHPGNKVPTDQVDSDSFNNGHQVGEISEIVIKCNHGDVNDVKGFKREIAEEMIYSDVKKNGHEVPPKRYHHLPQHKQTQY